MAVCNPQESGVISRQMQEALALRRTAELKDNNPSLLKQLGLCQQFANSFIAIDNQASVFPELKPWVNLVKLGEKIRARFAHMYQPTIRAVSNLNDADSASIMKVVEALNAGMKGAENADGSYTITAADDLVGLKKGESFTLNPKLNAVRKDSAEVLDHIYDNIIKSVKASLGYDPDIETKAIPNATDRATIRMLEEARRENYFPQVRRGRFAVEYFDPALAQKKIDALQGGALSEADKRELKRLQANLAKNGGEKVIEGFEAALGAGGLRTSRKRAMQRSAEMQKAGMKNVRVRDLQQERELMEAYVPDVDSLSSIDALFQSIMVPSKKNAYEETKKVIERLRSEAEHGRQGRLRRRRDVPGWLREDNFSSYFRSTFPSYTFTMTDWVANKATELGRRETINAIKNPQVKQIAEDAERYLHSDDSLTAKLKGLAYLYTIGGNISSALVQPTQILHTTWPLLSGIAGTGRAALATMKAGTEVLRSIRFTTDPEKIFNFDAIKGDERRRLVEELFKNGTIEPMLTRDQAPSFLARSQDPNLYALGKGTGKVMEVMSLAFSVSESVNRLTTALATYDLIKDQKSFARLQKMAEGTGDTINTPLDAVEWAVNETQFTMGKGFRAANMRGMVGGLSLQFTPFAFKMLGFQRRAMEYYGGKGLMSLDVGKKVMSLHLLGLFATAGLWGLPFAAPVGDLLDKLLREVGPELGMTPTALKAELRETIQQLFKEVPELSFVGTPAELADYVLNGPFRATGIDISKRTALDVVPENLLSLDLLNMGPLMGAVKGGIEDAVMYHRKGMDLMAVASLFPIAFRNAARSQAMQEVGYISPGKLEPVLPAREMQDMGDIFRVAIGFTPTKVAEAREALRETKELGTKTEGLRRSYSDKIAVAMAKFYQTKDPAFREEAIALRNEVMERDKGKAPRDRIIQDPSSFNSGISEKVKKIIQPQSKDAVPKVVQREYMERIGRI